MLVAQEAACCGIPLRRWRPVRRVRRAGDPVAPARSGGPFARAGSRCAPGRSAFRGLGPIRDRRGRDGRGLGRAPRGDHQRVGRSGPGRRPAVRDSGITGQGRVRRRRRGPRGRRPRAPAAARHRRHLPIPASPGSTCARYRPSSTRDSRSRPATTVSASVLLEQLGTVPGLSQLLERLEPDGLGEGPAAIGIAAAAVEFALEGLYLNKRLAKDSDGSRRSTAPELLSSGVARAASATPSGCVLARRPRPARDPAGP